MSYSKVKYTYTSGGSTTFSYSNIDVLGAGADPVSEQLDVYLNDALLVLTLDYTINTGAETITLTSRVTSGMATGSVIVIQRSTKLNDRYVDWTNNAGIDETDLDLEGDQHLFIEQELSDELDLTMKKNVSETYWDGQFLPSVNCSPATDGSGWTTLNQVQNLLAGGETASLGEFNDWCFEGNGTNDDFLLSGAASNTTVENLMVSINGVTLCPCGTTRINTDVAGAKASGLIESTSAGVTGTRSYHISQFNTFTSGRESALAGTDYKVNLEYYAHTISGSMPGGVPANGSTFRGTKAQLLAWLATWSDDVTNMVVSYDADVVGIDVGYTWDQTTRTLTITPPPAVGDDICVRQITGTVAVDLGNLSLDGSELQNDSIGLRHIDMAGETYYTGDESSATASSWPAGTDKILLINTDGSPYLGLINSTFITNFTSAVTAIRLNQLTVPNGSVNMNSNKIINVQAGTNSTDAVNYAQVSSIINNNLPAITDRMKYGEPPNGSGTAPDFYFNTNQTTVAGGSRTSTGSHFNDSVAGTVPRLVEYDQTFPTLNDTNCLAKLGFFPRSIKIVLAGRFGRRNNGTNANPNWFVGGSDTNYYWMYDKLILEEFNGFDDYDIVNQSPVITDNSAVKVRKYYLNQPTRIGKKDGGDPGGVAVDNPSGTGWILDDLDAALYIEQGGSYRVWLALSSGAPFSTRWNTLAFRNYSQTSDTADAGNIGAIQIFASRGGNPIAI